MGPPRSEGRGRRKTGSAGLLHPASASCQSQAGDPLLPMLSHHRAEPMGQSSAAETSECAARYRSLRPEDAGVRCFLTLMKSLYMNFTKQWVLSPFSHTCITSFDHTQKPLLPLIPSLPPKPFNFLISLVVLIHPCLPCLHKSVLL